MNKSTLIYLILFMPALSYAQCDIVAEIFNTTICQADIEFKNNNSRALPLAPERVNKIEKMRLAKVIREISANNLLNKDSYTPSKEEINSYTAFREKSEISHVIKNKELIATIEHLLETYRYTDSNRKRLERGLTTFRRSMEQSIKIKESMKLGEESIKKRSGEDAVNDFRAKLKKGQHQASEQWVGRWKMNKALYEKYGGRIIFQQAGIEPIDAYRALLRDIREKGKLKILKKTHKDVFSDFERYCNLNHNYLNNKDKKYFDRPYWETADLAVNRQKAIDEYKRIPHK